MKAKKLPSGKYRCRVWDNIKGKQVSFTASTAKEAEAKAMRYKLEMDRAGEHLLFAEAYESYIAGRENILSPATISSYANVYRMLADIQPIPLDRLDSKTVQSVFNRLAKEYAPASLRLAWKLTSAVYSEYMPDRRLTVRLPRIEQKQKAMPTDEDLKRLLEVSKGTDMYIPICLAMFCSLRLGEVAALTVNDFSERDGRRYVTVNKTMVRQPDGSHIIKEPKTENSVRVIPCPDFLYDLVIESGTVTKHTTPKQIASAFLYIIKKYDLPAMSFHTLRHVYASKQVTRGYAKPYIQKTGGWTSEVLDSVYTHALSDEEERIHNDWLYYVADFVSNSCLM